MQKTCVLNWQSYLSSSLLKDRLCGLILPLSVGCSNLLYTGGSHVKPLTHRALSVWLLGRMPHWFEKVNDIPSMLLLEPHRMMLFLSILIYVISPKSSPEAVSVICKTPEGTRKNRGVPDSTVPMYTKERCLDVMSAGILSPESGRGFPWQLAVMASRLCQTRCYQQQQVVDNLTQRRTPGSESTANHLTLIQSDVIHGDSVPHAFIPSVLTYCKL